MSVARVIRIEGVETPCLALTEDGKLPEEIVVSFPKEGFHSQYDGREGVTFRLQPSSRRDPVPSYVEIFDE
ncbi:MAG: hypothetical protein HZB39_18400 [Planctomycetes bacterium]|nr:hypothetical protein [Planctomycetota bacterium]